MEVSRRTNAARSEAKVRGLTPCSDASIEDLRLSSGCLDFQSPRAAPVGSMMTLIQPALGISVTLASKMRRQAPAAVGDERREEPCHEWGQRRSDRAARQRDR